jgi:hypothetical protein
MYCMYPQVLNFHISGRTEIRIHSYPTKKCRIWNTVNWIFNTLGLIEEMKLGQIFISPYFYLTNFGFKISSQLVLLFDWIFICRTYIISFIWRLSLVSVHFSYLFFSLLLVLWVFDSWLDLIVRLFSSLFFSNLQSTIYIDASFSFQHSVHPVFTYNAVVV